MRPDVLLLAQDLTIQQAQRASWAGQLKLD